MTKEEMRQGFARGRTLKQEEWSTPAEIKAVDELVTEGLAMATPWEYKDNYQCEVRTVQGIPQPIKG